MTRTDYEAPTGYTIDVCATCGRQATYPFTCGHRSTVGLWTTPLQVVPTGRARAELTKIMKRNAQSDSPT